MKLVENQRHTVKNYHVFLNLKYQDVITLTKKSQDTRPLEFKSMALEELIKKLAPLLRGKDGRDGKDGKDGRDGRDGQRVGECTLHPFMAM